LYVAIAPGQDAFTAYISVYCFRPVSRAAAALERTNPPEGARSAP